MQKKFIMHIFEFIFNFFFEDDKFHRSDYFNLLCCISLTQFQHQSHTNNNFMLKVFRFARQQRETKTNFFNLTLCIAKRKKKKRTTTTATRRSSQKHCLPLICVAHDFEKLKYLSRNFILFKFNKIFELLLFPFLTLQF